MSLLTRREFEDAHAGSEECIARARLSWSTSQVWGGIVQTLNGIHGSRIVIVPRAREGVETTEEWGEGVGTVVVGVVDERRTLVSLPEDTPWFWAFCAYSVVASGVGVGTWLLGRWEKEMRKGGVDRRVAVVIKGGRR